MNQLITCINCPMGCRMTAELSDSGKLLSVSGNTCPRGKEYARQECTDPKRMITAVIPVYGSETPLSVKTNQPISKKLIQQVMLVLSEAKPVLPVHAGEIIVGNILNSGVDIIATRTLE